MSKPGLSRKIIHYLVPITAIIFFILIMQGAIYKCGPQDDRHELLNSKKYLTTDIQKNDWEAAAQQLDKLQQTWKRLIPRLQYHAEMEAIDGIERSLSRLRGYINAQEAGGALAELGEISERLENLTN